MDRLDGLETDRESRDEKDNRHMRDVSVVLMRSCRALARCRTQSEAGSPNWICEPPAKIKKTPVKAKTCYGWFCEMPSSCETRPSSVTFPNPSGEKSLGRGPRCLGRRDTAARCNVCHGSPLSDLNQNHMMVNINMSRFATIVTASLALC